MTARVLSAFRVLWTTPFRRTIMYGTFVLSMPILTFMLIYVFNEIKTWPGASGYAKLQAVTPIVYILGTAVIIGQVTYMVFIAVRSFKASIAGNTFEGSGGSDAGGSGGAGD